VSDELFSNAWYRVASLTPRIRGHARIHRHVYRGETWYVLQDQSSGRHHRFSETANQLIGLMDGRRTVQSVWERACEQLGDDAPTQDETIELLGKLHAADVLLCDVTPDSAELFRRHRRQLRTKWKQRLWSPLALRFPLIDPDAFLSRWVFLVRPLLGWVGGLAWLALIGIALVQAGAHWSELTEGGMERILAPHSLLVLWLSYPVVKALHELGHGFTTKAWGGEVHEMGIMLLVLFPIPYVDASAASAFPDRRKRMVVGAAGMMVELALAAIALFVWLAVEPGLVRDLAFNVMLIGGVSTVLFNGNPLLRFDGYYVLADALDIPNLGTRANKYLGYLCQRYLFGLGDATSPASAPGERGWFVGFGIASFVYRIFIMLAIVVFVASEYLFVGVVIGLWAVATQLLAPLAKAVAFVFASPRVQRRRVRTRAVALALVGVLAALVFTVPVPLWTRAEGVLWLPEHAHVRAGSDGFVTRVLVATDSSVKAGDPLIAREDPLLSAEVALLQGRVRELEVRFGAELVRDRVQADIVAEELESARADLARAEERAEALLIRSPADGIFAAPEAADLVGRFVRQGERIAYVIDRSALTVRAVVPQDDIGLVRERTRRVELRLAERLEEVIPVRASREVPGASHRLPSLALGTLGGGRIAVDARDPAAPKTFERVFQLELSLPPMIPVSGLGGRVFVRFDHGREPLGQQWYRMARQLLLSRFSV
jgi:putative peptide zinc metalloprotease protein